MGDEEVADVLTTYSCLFQLSKNAIPPTGINKEHPLLAMKCEASVVASGGQCIACTKHRDEIVRLMHKKPIGQSIDVCKK